MKDRMVCECGKPVMPIEHNGIVYGYCTMCEDCVSRALSYPTNPFKNLIKKHRPDFYGR